MNKFSRVLGLNANSLRMDEDGSEIGWNWMELEMKSEGVNYVLVFCC